MGGQLEDYLDTPVGKDCEQAEAPPTSVNYNATIYGHSCSITLSSMDKTSLDELVELIVNYLEA